MATPASTASPAVARRWPLPPFVQGSVALHAASALALAAEAALWPWALGALVANHAALIAAGLWPRSSLLGPNVTRLPPAAARAGQVAITIDDGPDPEVTPAVLDLLAEHHVHATFFCIAERARAQPALVRQIAAAGHSVQNHSREHPHHFSLMGPKALEQEIAGAQALLADLTGTRPIAFRAPAGLRNPLLDPLLHRQGLHLVSWSRRGFDTRERDPALVLARLCGGSRGLAGGDVLLLHDGHAARTAAGQPVVLAVLPALLRRLHEAGLKPVTLAEALPPRH
jgi:peptidoglycan-N-acetylglucosamine deacetylase